MGKQLLYVLSTALYVSLSLSMIQVGRIKIPTVRVRATNPSQLISLTSLCSLMVMLSFCVD